MVTAVENQWIMDHEEDGDTRERIIERAIATWIDRVAKLRPDLDPVRWVNECLDLAGLPRLRAEERAVIMRENLAAAPR